MDAEIIDTLEVCFDDLSTLDVEVGATPQQLLPLIETNNSLATTNKELVAINAEQEATIAEQAGDNTQLTENNEQLTATNKTLVNDILPTLRNGLQDKTVQPNESEQVVTADEGYVGLKSVTVKQSEYVPTVKWLGSGSSTYAGYINAIIDFSQRTDISRTFYSNKSLTGIYKIIVTSNTTNMGSMFHSCSSITSLDMSDWDTRNVTDISNMFCYWGTDRRRERTFIDFGIANWDTSNVTNINSLFFSTSFENGDFTKWNFGRVSSANGWINSSSIVNLIGDHTLAEVEAGDIVCFKDFGKCVSNIYIHNSPGLRYSSLLAVAQGLYDRSAMESGVYYISKTAYNNCKNDDDTIPNSATIAERQAKLSAICAAKNYTLSLS